MARISYTDREIPGGSAEARLSPRITERALNTKLGPRLPRISADTLYPRMGETRRRRDIGLPARFDQTK